MRTRIPDRLLVVNGSLNEVAFVQGRMARKNDFASVSLTPLALLAETPDGESARIAIANQIVALLSDSQDVVLSSVQNRDDCASFNIAGALISPDIKKWPELIALNTGRVIAKTISLCEPVDAIKSRFALVVFGGDTLAGIARANHWKGFVPRDEVFPGVAICDVPEQQGLVLVSKPGGFGDDDVLLKLRAAAKA